MNKENGTNVPTGRDNTYDRTEVRRKSIEELFETSFNADQKKALLGMDIGGGSVDVDPTLTQEGMAADAKATGEAIASVIVDTDPTLTREGVPADAKAVGDVVVATAAMVGSPLVASTVAGMTDHNKVYVYTGSETGYTAGNWYYWNGSAWTSGGVYNSSAVSTDTSLTQSGAAADAKVVGDKVAALNTVDDTFIDMLQATKRNPTITPGGDFYVAANGYKVASAVTSASHSLATEPFYVRKGDVITVYTVMPTNQSVLALHDSADAPNNGYSQLITASSARWGTYTLTAEKNGYVYAFQRVGANVTAFSSSFKVTVEPHSSGLLEDMQHMAQALRNKPYFGVRQGGNFTAVSGFTSNSGVDLSLELLFKINTITTGWFYGGGSTGLFAINSNANNNSITASINSGSDYTTRTLFPAGTYKGQIIHIVFTYDHTEKIKKVYFNGVLIGTSAALTQAQNFNDSFSASGDITLYRKRVWQTCLPSEAVTALWNNGYPTETDLLPTNAMDHLYSELVPSGIGTDGKWTDNASGLVVTLREGHTLITANAFDISTDLAYTKAYVDAQLNIPVREIIRPEFSKIRIRRGTHDCTFIGNYYVSFVKPSEGASHYIDMQNMTYGGTFQVNFTEETTRELEMKSADYKYNKLLVGNGRAIKYEETDYTEQGAKLYVFYAADTWPTLGATVTFENCGNYDVIDVADLGYKVYGFWGQYDDCVYVSCNLFDDIYLIQLGKGTTDFGSGTYVAADAGRYNGSYKILGHWHHDNYFGIYAAHGGQFYKGHLYIAINDDSICRVLKFRLNNDGSMEVDYIDFTAYMETDPTKLVWRYIDGLCIQDDIMYVQPLIKNGSYTDSGGTVADILTCDI